MKIIAIIAIAGLALFATAAAAHQSGWGHGSGTGHMSRYHNGGGHTPGTGHMNGHRNFQGNCPMNNGTTGRFMANPGLPPTGADPATPPASAQ